MPADIIALFEGYGLIGLVIGALVSFVLLFIFEMRRVNKSSAQFIKRILEDNRDERDSTSKRFTQSTDRMADAISELTKSLRDTDERN